MKLKLFASETTQTEAVTKSEFKVKSCTHENQAEV